jgi:hypothetical protein
MFNTFVTLAEGIPVSRCRSSAHAHMPSDGYRWLIEPTVRRNAFINSSSGKDQDSAVNHQALAARLTYGSDRGHWQCGEGRV